VSTTPSGPSDHDQPPPPSPPPPPAPAGPWASDNLPTNPLAATANVVEQPPSIVTAVRLMWAGAALTAVGVLLSFTQTDAIREQIEDSDSSLSPSEVDTAVSVGIAFSVVFGIVGVGLWLWMANANGKGHSWARTVATVLGGLNAFSAVISLVASGTATTLSIVLTIISLVLAVVILVLLYRPDSSAFYAARSRIG
jgi:hypothetical protein